MNNHIINFKHWQKSFLIFLSLLAIAATTSAQQFSFSMREVDGGSYTVSIDLTNKRVAASRNGASEFNYTYNRYQYDSQKGIIGFAFNSGSVPMRPSNDYNAHYFLVRPNEIYAKKPSSYMGYRFQPTDMTNYTSEYSNLIEAVSKPQIATTSPNSSNNVVKRASVEGEINCGVVLNGKLLYTMRNVKITGCKDENVHIEIYFENTQNEMLYSVPGKDIIPSYNESTWEVIRINDLTSADVASNVNVPVGTSYWKVWAYFMVKDKSSRVSSSKVIGETTPLIIELHKSNDGRYWSNEM